MVNFAVAREMMKAQIGKVGPSMQMAGKTSCGSWLLATGNPVRCLKVSSAQVLAHHAAM
jgi:hypothetical protein